MKVKLFTQINTNSKVLDMTDLENKINSWLNDNSDIRIIDIKQSSNGGSFSNTKCIFSIWYEEAQ